MPSNLIIVTDLQRFKLFTSKIDPLGRKAVEMLEGSESLDIHQRLREKVSDQQGNFQGVGASGSGEDHNIGLEEERRRIKEIAQQINKTVQRHGEASWYFSAPKAINNQIIELLHPAVKATMTVNVHADLTKIPDDQLLEHFKK
ncbi:MAG TPA: host attachment protein [Sulfuricurvum sp.]|nr:host attachment protein [Sulfuricurvum sp.]